MRRFSIVLSLIFCALLSLTGCGVMARQQQAQAVAEHAEKMKQAREIARSAMQECKDRRLRGEIRTYVDSVRCSNDRVQAAYRDASYPYIDLVGLYTAARLAGAEQIDHGASNSSTMMVLRVGHLHRPGRTAAGVALRLAEIQGI
jgi:hypothetical protein